MLLLWSLTRRNHWSEGVLYNSTPDQRYVSIDAETLWEVKAWEGRWAINMEIPEGLINMLKHKGTHRPRRRLRFRRSLSDAPCDACDRKARRGPDHVAASNRLSGTGDEWSPDRRSSKDCREGKSATLALDSTYSKCTRERKPAMKRWKALTSLAESSFPEYPWRRHEMALVLSIQ